VIPEALTGIAQGDDLGVRRGVVAGQVAIPAAPDDSALADDDRAHRHLAHLQRALGAAEGFFHPEFVGESQLSAASGQLPVRRKQRVMSSKSCPGEHSRLVAIRIVAGWTQNVRVTLAARRSGVR
jgi:hypothetical protein